MTELAIRWCLAGLLTVASGWLGAPSPLVAWTIAGLFGAMAVVRWRRELDPTQAAWMATFDGTALLVVLADAGELATLGWLAILPLADAVVRHRATALRLGAVFAGLVLAAHFIFIGGEPHWTLYLQLLGMYGMAVALHPLHHERHLKPLEEPLVVDPEGLLALRENFRKLRDAYRQREQRHQTDHLLATLLRARLAPAPLVAPHMANTLREELGATAVLIAGFRSDGRLEKLAASGNFGFDPGQLGSLSPGRDRREMLETTLIDRLDEASRQDLHYVTWPQGEVPTGAILVKSEKKASSLLEQAAPIVGEVIDSAAHAAQQFLQLQRVELLFSIARSARSALGPESLAQRYVELVREWFSFDHCSVHLVDPEGDRVLAFSGPSIWLIDHLQFSAGSGVLGWLAEGHPTLLQNEAASDPKLDRAEGLRQKVGRYLLLPLRDARGCYGFLQVVNHESRLPEGDTMDLLRRTLEELSFGLRMQGVRSAPWGSLVALEPIRELSDRELESLRRRIQGVLPVGGVLRWRAEGGFVALLPKMDDRFLVRWAQQLAESVPGDWPLRVRVGDSMPITAAVIQADREPNAVGKSLVA